MQKFKSVPTTENVLSHVHCNKCATEMKMPENEYLDDKPCYHDFLTSFGLNSSFDMQSWNFDLCENCLLDFVKSFKIMPNGFCRSEKYPEEVFAKWHQTGQLDTKAGWTEDDYRIEQEKLSKYNQSVDWMYNYLDESKKIRIENQNKTIYK